MKKSLKAVALTITLGITLSFTPYALLAGDDPEDCPPQQWTNGIYNMKNKWFGGCKTKCSHFCEVDGEAGIDLPDITIKPL